MINSSNMDSCSTFY